jgi:hypothetical protein
MITIGIDPGKKGAIVALDENASLIEAIAADEPGGYCDGGEYLPRVLADWFEELKDSHKIRVVILEKQQARPMEGRSSCFTTGYGFGLLVGVVASAKLPYRVVSPTKWTKDVLGGVKGSERKVKSVAHVQARIPELSLTWGRRKKAHDGLSDAGCLALWGMSHGH